MERRAGAKSPAPLGPIFHPAIVTNPPCTSSFALRCEVRRFPSPRPGRRDALLSAACRVGGCPLELALIREAEHEALDSKRCLLDPPSSRARGGRLEARSGRQMDDPPAPPRKVPHSPAAQPCLLAAQSRGVRASSSPGAAASR